MRFTLTIDMDNAAFDHKGEIPRILRDVAGRVNGLSARREAEGSVRDINGNTVGRWEITS